MPRPKQFDPADALATATRCFWRRGYNGASVEVLTGDMGIGRASLYATYGGKSALFLAALGRYADAMVERFTSRLDPTPDPIGTIRALLREVARVSAEPGGRDGCFMTNSAAELAGHDAAVRALLAERYRRIEDAFARALARAQRSGDLAKGRSPRPLARFLVTTVQGLQLMGKVRPEARALRDVADSALRCLE